MPHHTHTCSLPARMASLVDLAALALPLLALFWEATLAAAAGAAAAAVAGFLPVVDTVAVTLKPPMLTSPMPSNPPRARKSYEVPGSSPDTVAVVFLSRSAYGRHECSSPRPCVCRNCSSQKPPEGNCTAHEPL